MLSNGQVTGANYQYSTRILKTFQYISEHPIRASLKTTFFNLSWKELFLSDRDHDVLKDDNDVHRILVQLARMGLHSLIGNFKEPGEETLLGRFLRRQEIQRNRQNDTNNPKEEALQGFYEDLSKIVEIISRKEFKSCIKHLEKWNKEVAKLERLINAFAENCNLPRRLVKRIDLEAELNVRKKIIPTEATENQQEHKEDTHQAERASLLNRNTPVQTSEKQSSNVYYQYDLDDNALEKIGQLLEEHPSDPSDYVYVDVENFAQKLSKQGKKRLRKENRQNQWSILISVIMSIGEGVVPAILSGWSLALAFPLIFVPAFLVNYFLLRAASNETLRDWFANKFSFSADEQGKKLSMSRRMLLWGAIPMAIGAGIALGVLSFSAGLQGWGTLILGSAATAAFSFVSSAALYGVLGIAAASIFLILVFEIRPAVLGLLLTGVTIGLLVGVPTTGVTILAGMVALASTAALSTLFYFSLADLIKNYEKRLQQLKNYFKENFIAPWKDAKTFMERAEAVLRWFWSAILVAGAITVCVLVSVSSLGLYHQKACELFTQAMHMIPSAAEKLSYAIVVGCGTIGNVNFFVKSTILFFNYLSHGIYGSLKFLWKLIIDPSKALEDVRKFWEAFGDNVIAKLDWIGSRIAELFLLTCVASNTYGQACGPYLNEVSYTCLIRGLAFPTVAAPLAAGISAGIGSAGANIQAVLDVVEPVGIVDSTLAQYAQTEQWKRHLDEGVMVGQRPAASLDAQALARFSAVAAVNDEKRATPATPPSNVVNPDSDITQNTSRGNIAGTAAAGLGLD